MPRAKDEEEQQQRIAELQKSQRYWKSIAENSPDHVMILDMEYKIQFINHTVPDLTIEEVIGRSNLDFVPADSHLMVTECFERVKRSGKPDKYEIRYIGSDGETQFFDVRVSPLKDEDGNTSALISTSNNITERKKMEEALRDSEERYRSLSEAAFEAIFISEKGICLEQNHTAEILFGYTSSEAVGRSGTEWIAPEDRDKVMKNMLSGYEEAYEVTALRKDGSTFPSEIQAKMMPYKGRTVRITALNDITKRKQACFHTRVKQCVVVIDVQCLIPIVINMIRPVKGSLHDPAVIHPGKDCWLAINDIVFKKAAVEQVAFEIGHQVGV